MFKAGKYWLPDGEKTEHFIKAFKKGGWDLDRLDAVLEFVTNWEVAIDGGAHVGSWSRTMAKKFKTVYSFEPNPENYECLVENTRKIKNIKCFQCALSDIEEKVEMADDEKWPGMSGGKHIIGPGEIEAKPLDSFNIENVGFLKLDVEGYEPKVLMGAKETIEKYHPIIMIEYKPRILKRYGEKSTVLEILDSFGYIMLGGKDSDIAFGYKDQESE